MDTLAGATRRPGTDMLAQLVKQVLDGKDAVVVDAGGGASFLRDAALQLKDHRCRVVCVSAAVPGIFPLSAMLAQVTEQLNLDTQDDETLKRGFQHLTVPDLECDRIVLMIDGADTLQDTVFRYLTFACRAATELQLVLAGRADPAAQPGIRDDFLRTRLTKYPAFWTGLDWPRTLD